MFREFFPTCSSQDWEMLNKAEPEITECRLNLATACKLSPTVKWQWQGRQSSIE